MTRLLLRWLAAPFWLLVGAFLGFTGFQLWWLNGLLGDELITVSTTRRYFSRPLALDTRTRIAPGSLSLLLDRAGLRPDSGAVGGFRALGSGRFELRLRPEDQPSGSRVTLATDAAGRLTLSEPVVLAPALLAEDAPEGTAQEWIPIEALPPALLLLVQAVEDRRFARHDGFDLRGLLRALWANVRSGGVVEGGSTITQQWVKRRYLDDRRTLWRKYNEVLLAVLLERRHGKAKILEAYLNDVYLGQQGGREIRGFPAAARHYFGQPLDRLDVSELALLVGLLKGPSWYHPRRHPDRAKTRRDVGLRALYDTGHLSRTDYQAARVRPLGVRDAGASTAGGTAVAFMDLVRRQLGRSAGAGPVNVPTGLDLRIQLAAEEALQGALAERPELQGAVVVANRRDGSIVAAVGDRRPAFPGFNRVADARRQIGSVVKPFYYGLALTDRRVHLLSPLEDERLELTTADGEPWVPENFAGGGGGTVPVVTALAESRNRASVALGLELGLGAVREEIGRLGWPHPVPEHPSLLLGALEMTPLEVAQLYLSLSRGGRVTPLSAVAPRRRLGAGRSTEAFVVGYALVHAVERGTGRSFAPPAVGELAGKTGTSNEGRDAWFAGWTADYVLVVWVGRDDGGAAGLTGARHAGPVVRDLAPLLLGGPVLGEPPADVTLLPVDLRRRVQFDAPCPAADHLPFFEQALPEATRRCPSR